MECKIGNVHTQYGDFVNQLTNEGCSEYLKKEGTESPVTAKTNDLVRALLDETTVEKKESWNLSIWDR